MLAKAASVTRLSCYCRDCQTYAHVLGDAARTLDSLGGTEVVATLQQHVGFTRGRDSLACLSLSERGLLRWYARCCNTPIANITRDPKLSYVGIVHTFLGDSAARDRAFGPARLSVNTRYAKGELRSSSLGMLVSTARILGPVLRARVSGSWRRSPFFEAGTSRPAVPVRVVNPEMREIARRAV